MARPFFINYINSLENDPDLDFGKASKFKVPESEMTVEMDCNKYESLYGNKENKSLESSKNRDEMEEEGIEQ